MADVDRLQRAQPRALKERHVYKEYPNWDWQARPAVEVRVICAAVNGYVLDR